MSDVRLSVGPPGGAGDKAGRGQGRLKGRKVILAGWMMPGSRNRTRAVERGFERPPVSTGRRRQHRGNLLRMKTTFAALLALLVLATSPASAQTALQLRWELRGDVFADARDRGASRAVFTLTNNDTKPLPARGWAIYFNALLPRTPGSEKGGIVIEQVIGELFRIVPGPSFTGLAPGEQAQFEVLDRAHHERDAGAGGPVHRVRREPLEGIRDQELRGAAVRAARPAGACAPRGHARGAVRPQRRHRGPAGRVAAADLPHTVGPREA